MERDFRKYFLLGFVLIVGIFLVGNVSAVEQIATEVDYFHVTDSELEAQGCGGATTSVEHLACRAKRYCVAKGYEFGIQNGWAPDYGGWVYCARGEAVESFLVANVDLESQNCGGATTSVEHLACRAKRYCVSRGYGFGIQSELGADNGWIHCAKGEGVKSFLVADSTLESPRDCGGVKNGPEHLACRAKTYCVSQGFEFGVQSEWGADYGGWVDCVKDQIIPSSTTTKKVETVVGSISDGYKIEPQKTVEITAHGSCRVVQNIGDKTYLIPTRTPEEWKAFLDNSPTDISLKNCMNSCSDGTVSGECSLQKPFLCANGKLIEKSQTCGCPAGKTAIDSGSCLGELNLYMGDGIATGKYNIFVISDFGYSDTIEYLDASFGDGDFSLFKTNPFGGQEDKFNVFYSLAPALDYSDSPTCEWAKTYGIKGIENFDAIFNKYNWINTKIYLTQDPQTWPHAGGYIKASINCSNFGNKKSFATMISHELGHSFGKLQDEYVYSSGGSSVSRKNCESVTPGRWDGISGYEGSSFSGCTVSTLFRGTYNSIMRDSYFFGKYDWADAWGPINKHYLNLELERYG
jgi:hypothetical protein